MLSSLFGHLSAAAMWTVHASRGGCEPQKAYIYSLETSKTHSMAEMCAGDVHSHQQVPISALSAWSLGSWKVMTVNACMRKAEAREGYLVMCDHERGAVGPLQAVDCICYISQGVNVQPRVDLIQHSNVSLQKSDEY